MKTTLLATVLIFTSTWAWAAESTPYYRFWQGFKRSDLTQEAFSTGLDKNFISKTVEVGGGGKGLIAYLPALTPESKPEGVPDEIALVIYQSEDAYKALRATPEGAAYADSHWSYFDRAKSASRVPVLFAGAVDASSAYLLTGRDVNWQQGDSLLSVYLRRSSASPKDYLDALKRILDQAAFDARASGDIREAAVFVSADYVLVYQNGGSPLSFKAPVLSRFVAIPLQKQAFGSTHLLEGSGLSVVFPTTK
ncbi:MAG: hypothetical protein ACXWP5_14270 [Bdellovibrionota bacterium]